MPGALHEVYAADWGASGFAACLAVRAAGASLDGRGGPLFWVRPDYEALEYGALHAQGLAELGGRPEKLFLVRTPNAAEALAGRRLNFLAAQSGVTAILLQEGAHPLPSAAQTRWQISSAPSNADDDDWGMPVFAANLCRNRLGATGHWRLTWNPADGLFHELRHEHYAPHPGLVAAALFDRPAEKKRRIAL
jgi:protein ImuA